MDDALDATRDRRRVTDDALVSGGITATLDGGGGERGGRGEMGLADGGNTIAVPYGPSTTRGAHRGSTTALDCVLLVSGVRLPNNLGHVGGDRDLSAERRHLCVCVDGLVVWSVRVTYGGYLQTFLWGFK